MGRPVEAPSSDYSFSSNDMFGGDIYVNPGASITITLPDCLEYINVSVWHVGAAFTILINKPDATLLYTLTTLDQVNIRSYTDSSGIPQYEAIAMLNSAGAIADGDYGDITVSGSGTVWNLDLALNQIDAPTGSVNFADQQATSFRFENRTSDPGAPTVGQVWLRTDL